MGDRKWYLLSTANRSSIPSCNAREFATMSAPGRYQIAEIPGGIRIDGEDRPPVDLFIRPFALEAQYVSDGGPMVRERFGLFNFGKALEFVASGLMRQWQGREGWYGA